MARVLTTLHLSDVQKEVLAKVKAAPTPHVAWSDVIAADRYWDGNFASARDTLGNLGLLEVGDGELELTDKGTEVMKDENLVDETGELSQQGKELASIDREAKPEQPEAMPNGAEPDVMAQDDAEFPMESLKLIRQINEKLNDS